MRLWWRPKPKPAPTPGQRIKAQTYEGTARQVYHHPHLTWPLMSVVRPVAVIDDIRTVALAAVQAEIGAIQWVWGNPR
jgi:hypothetical protein